MASGIKVSLAGFRLENVRAPPPDSRWHTARVLSPLLSVPFLTLGYHYIGSMVISFKFSKRQTLRQGFKVWAGRVGWWGGGQRRKKVRGWQLGVSLVCPGEHGRQYLGTHLRVTQ